MLALMDISANDNRVPEALQWLARYNAFVPQVPEYPGLRFSVRRVCTVTMMPPGRRCC